MPTLLPPQREASRGFGGELLSIDLKTRKPPTLVSPILAYNKGEGWLYSTRKKIRGSNCDPTQADPTLFGTRPAYSKGISQNVPFKSPYSLEYPTRNLIERVKTTPISPGSFKGSSPTKTVLKSVLPGDPGYFRSKFTRDAMASPTGYSGRLPLRPPTPEEQDPSMYVRVTARPGRGNQVSRARAVTALMTGGTAGPAATVVGALGARGRDTTMGRSVTAPASLGSRDARVLTGKTGLHPHMVLAVRASLPSAKDVCNSKYYGAETGGGYRTSPALHAEYIPKEMTADGSRVLAYSRHGSRRPGF